MCSDSEKNMSAFADQNHAPSLTCVRLEFALHSVGQERETALLVQWTNAQRRPRRTLGPPRPRTLEEPSWALLSQRERAIHRITLSLYENKKSARRDSNPRPRPWQGRAPPTEPLAHFLCCRSPQRQIILYLIYLNLTITFFKKF